MTLHLALSLALFNAYSQSFNRYCSLNKQATVSIFNGRLFLPFIYYLIGSFLAHNYNAFALFKLMYFYTYLSTNPLINLLNKVQYLQSHKCITQDLLPAILLPHQAINIWTLSLNYSQQPIHPMIFHAYG